MDYSALSKKHGGAVAGPQNLSVGVDYASLAKKYNASNLPTEQKKSVGGFVGNVLKSTGELATGLFDMVVHPIKTLQGLGNIALGTVSPSYAGEEFEPGTTAEEAQAGKGIKPVEQSKQVQTLDAVVDHYVERYGGKNPQEVLKNIYDTAYEDPVGFLLDASVVLEGAGLALGSAKVAEVQRITKLAQEATKAGDLAKAAELSAKAAELSMKYGKVAEIGSKITKAGEAINPIRQGANVVKAGVKLVPGAVDLGKSLATFGTSQATGLSPESIKRIIANPENFSPSAMKTFTREGLAEEAIAKIEGRLKGLAETGKEYGTIRNAPNAVIKLEPNFFADLLEKKTGLAVDYGGKITADTLSQIRNPSEVAKLQNIFDRYNPLFKQGEMTNAEFLNLRSDLAEMAKFEGGIGRSKPLENLSGIIRGELNSKYRPQVEGLEKLDTVFGAEASELKAIKRDYFNKNGTLKDNAVSKIANLTGKGKEAVLGRMEKIMPGISDRVITLKAIEDIQAAVGQKVGTYTRAAMVGGGVLTLNPAVIAAAIISSPQIAVQILRGFGKLLNVKDATLQKIITEYERTLKNIKANPEGGFIKLDITAKYNTPEKVKEMIEMTKEAIKKTPKEDGARLGQLKDQLMAFEEKLKELTSKTNDVASAEMREILNDLKSGRISDEEAIKQLREQDKKIKD